MGIILREEILTMIKISVNIIMSRDIFLILAQRLNRTSLIASVLMIYKSLGEKGNKVRL